MPSVQSGEQIVCSNGHVCGSFVKDAADGASITQDYLSFDLDKLDFADGTSGYLCRECKEWVIRFRDSDHVFSVHTAHGWIGRVTP